MKIRLGAIDSTPTHLGLCRRHPGASPSFQTLLAFHMPLLCCGKSAEDFGRGFNGWEREEGGPLRRRLYAAIRAF